MKASIIDLKVQYEKKHDRLIDSLIWHFGGTIYELNVDLCMFYTCVILINLSYLCRYQAGKCRYYSDSFSYYFHNHAYYWFDAIIV